MPGIVVDSNVILDLMTEDKHWLTWSAEALREAANTSRIIFNAVVYAEVSVHVSRTEDLDAFLPKTIFEREPIPYDAAFLAGPISSGAVTVLGSIKKEYIGTSIHYKHGGYSMSRQ